jgi:hypothetical protein
MEKGSNKKKLVTSFIFCFFSEYHFLGEKQAKSFVIQSCFLTLEQKNGKITLVKLIKFQ